MLRPTVTLLCALSAANGLSIKARNNVDLKIMPMGASITRGLASTGEVGYRLDLRNLLQQDGQNVTYVGSVSSGDMTNNLHEGHPGYTIADVDGVAKTDGAYDYKPNVILLNAGTNDCNIAGKHPETAPQRYATLLADIHKNASDALVVASSLVPNLKDSVDQCIQTLNVGLHEAVQNATKTGQKLGWVDMYHVVPKSEIHTNDSTHPTDAGYKLMAEAWYKEIKNQYAQITPPDPSGKPA